MHLFSKNRNIQEFLALHKFHFLAFGLLFIWVLMHIPGFFYGTEKTPLHQTYVGDEQVSVNSALRILNEKSIFAFRNREMQYYGPMFVVIDTPGVVLDYAWKYVTGVVHSPEEYKEYIIWDWGGIIKSIRATAILSMLLGLLLVFQIARTALMNPSGNRYIPYLVTILVAVNYFYFEYSHFSIHWAYIIPLLFLQWFTLVRIIETNGKQTKYWVWHGVAMAVSFGVSYMSLIFMSMWWPTLWRMWKDRDVELFKTYAVMKGVTALACVLIVWWHPYAFFRILSFMGIGEPMHNIGDAQNPFVLQNPSWVPYITQIIVNNLGVVIALTVLVVVLWRTRVLYRGVLWMILFPGIMNYFLFAPAEHHEGRYALPTIVALFFVFGYLLSEYLKDTGRRKRFISILLGLLVSWYIGFSFVHVVLWMHIFAQGPIEYEAIEYVHELQKTGAPVLIINSYILGYPHTKDSYRAFAKHRNFGDIPLYVEIYKNPLPSDRIPLDARYEFLRVFNENPSIVNDYAHVLYLHRPRPKDWNQFTFFDEDIVRNWFYRDLSPKYIILK